MGRPSAMRNTRTALKPQALGRSAVFSLCRSCVPKTAVRLVDEHHDVGVLFDGAGFAEVGQLRAALFAFGCARELAEDEHGKLQFLGKTFEAARDAGNFFLTIVEAAATGDQLKIIDDNQ